MINPNMAAAAHHRLLLLGTGPSHPSGRGRPGYHHEATFDANMVIILAALLCALICALGLNSIVRCALRCTRRLPQPPPTSTTSSSSSSGIGKTALRRIPVLVYGAPPSPSSASSECAICLGELTEGDKVRMLPVCCHGFHVACIDTWLLSHSSCPTCRRSLLLLPDASSSSLAIPVVELP